MPNTLSDEQRLEESFNELARRLREPDVLNPQHGAAVFYLVFPPSQILTVRRLLPAWMARLQHEQDLQVQQVSLAEILWELVDESRRWEGWLAVEGDFEQEQVNDAIASVLRENNAFVQRVVERALKAEPGQVVFLTDVELLHPYFRTRPIEGALHQQAQAPVVFLYPGRRAGQYGLHFLGFYPEDPGYRSSLIGGLA
ncbi:MAG TPA: DUF1788 domain-containing protein [Anaerolineaceae bacterium]|nr:DUF1788 domain-containing protein [Anaerolineaceae bacterium]